MRQQIEKDLLQITKHKTTILLKDLEMIVPKVGSYDTFSTLILSLENDGILSMIKSHGRNHHTPSLAYKYRIHRHALNQAYHRELQTYRLKLHETINLDAYFHLDHATWTKDLPYLEKIHTYIETHGLPSDEEKVPAPERSFEIIGDEKWLEQGGSDVLKRIQLFDLMNIFPVSDPLMFAINPTQIMKLDHFHLIVENKTTYQALLPVMTDTMFSTLIYGSGNKIPKSIENFHNQFPVLGNHTFFYFGDIDQSGITIWHSLQQRQQTMPALPFYEACLAKKKVYGKTNQRKSERALQQFCRYFRQEKSDAIQALLHKGAYFPQEVLNTKELQRIWIETDWSILQANISDESEVR